jgi:prepilin-type N-terminal cleavage/methylation domain-containing protein
MKPLATSDSPLPAPLRPVGSQSRRARSLLRKSSAFTLIELLVVIAIIITLAGLGFGGLQGAMESSKRAQARNDVNQIAAAVKAYQLEFGRLPEDGSVIAALTGDNSKKIVFLEAKNAKNGKGGLDGGSMKDPWGATYDIRLDTDYDNRVDGQLTTVIAETTTPDGKKINNVQ